MLPVHPRTRARLDEAGIDVAGGVRLLEPLEYLDFIALQADARLVVTDSGGVQEETSALGVPCLTYRTTTERPVTVTHGTNELVGLDPDGARRGVRAAAREPAARAPADPAVGRARRRAGMSVGGKSDATWALVEEHEPTAADVQRLYRALSDADATAARTFLAAENAPVELRKRYEDDLAVAGPTLGLAAVDRSGDPRVAQEIGVIGRQLPAYAGLVEAARVNNQQGLPIGGAYLREASHLMRTEILPAAERLYLLQTERVAAERDDAVEFPYLGLLLVLVTLAALAATQVYLARVFRRRLNLGMLAATVAVVIGLGWSGVALALHAGRAEDAQPERVAALVQARITALQARANELLALVARGNGGSYLEEFDQQSKELVGADGMSGTLGLARETADGQVAAALANTAGATRGWIEAYDRVRELDDNGEYDDAVALAVDQQGSGASVPAFAQLDASLEKAIQSGREQFVGDTADAARALTLLTAGWAILAAVAAAGVSFGLWQRLKEFR